MWLIYSLIKQYIYSIIFFTFESFPFKPRFLTIFCPKSWLLFYTHFSAGLHKQRTYLALFLFGHFIWCFSFYAHSSATVKTWAILIGNSPRKRRIWRPLTKSLWWIWIRTSLQDSPFSIQSLCSMSEKNDYFGPSCILLHTHNYPRAFSHDFQKIIDIPFTISAIAEIIRIWSSVFFFLIFPEPKTKCFVNKTVMLSMLLYHSPLLIFIYPSFGCCLQ